LSKINLVRISQ